MIHRAKFQNFKALRDVEITFDSRLTVLVGPNGSGKTSVLQGIHFFCLGFRNQPSALSYPQMPELLFSRGAEGEMILELSADLGSDKYHHIRYRAGFQSLGERGGVNQYMTRTEVAESADAPDDAWVLLPSGVPRGTKLVTSFLRLDPTQLAAVSIPQPQILSGIEENGAGCASVLASLALSDPVKFQLLLTELKKVIPTVHGLRFWRVPVQRLDRETVKIDGDELTRHVTREYTGEQLVFDFDSALNVPAVMVSEGTLLVTGLLATMISNSNPRTLLIDDLDHCLHPKAQMELIGVLRKLLEKYPDLQIIATSHSPYILDKLKPNEVRVMAIQDDGSAICKPLTDHPDFERWKESMSPGEFWTTFYEDWLTKTHKPQPVS